jgi:hypothetical protein
VRWSMTWEASDPRFLSSARLGRHGVQYEMPDGAGAVTVAMWRATGATAVRPDQPRRKTCAE